MKKVGIDCRLWGIKYSGIGRYTEELVRNLLTLDSENEYVLFCRKADFELLPNSKNVKKVIADIPHYGFAEQLKLPRIFKAENLDLLHSPHFNVPVLYTGKFVCTIHDLLWHEVKSWRATTLSAGKYAVKYLAYRGNVRSTVSRAKKIIVPTQTVKDDIVKRFEIPEDKVVVTYEGVSAQDNKKPAKRKMPFLLYVGNLYPHKNVELVVRALKLLKDKDLKLVIVSSRNVFQEKLREFVEKEGMSHKVEFAGRVSDKELATLYKTAEAYVFPSLSEGFGLPGLEAMASGLPLLAADIPVFREVYGKAPLYFEPSNPTALVVQLENFFKDSKKRLEMVKEGKNQASKYSWRKMALQTLQVYASVL